MGGCSRSLRGHTARGGRRGTGGYQGQPRPVEDRAALLGALRRNPTLRRVRPHYSVRANSKTHYHHYYYCRNHHKHGDAECTHRKNHRASDFEGRVWDLISGLLKDPERLRAGLDEMIEAERAGMRGDPEAEALAWH